uniref:alpha,alpha-phosphotrehalase n=1 Tax=Numidum massiliense TaxID=1522315 RepID=UPI000A5F728C|nr:alpha,alpha-phosphotrehalase [Numidum massiliense]
MSNFKKEIGKMLDIGEKRTVNRHNGTGHDDQWWRKAVVYQIYPKSFYDTTGSGTGDLQGIIAKLDYLQTLGVDVIWLTPIYESPQHDNGYDISDYYRIDPAYGTMADFEQLLEKAHRRDIKVIMDMVVNHTSTDHEWFQEAKQSRTNPFRSYYIWKDGKNSDLPNNWQSKFGGPAWAYDEQTDQYYLHLYDVTQADLNWENEQLRQSVYEIMHFWLQKGIDGFRLDVINLLSKDARFPDDDGSVPPGDGRKFYTDGPKIHQYLQEMNREVFRKYDMMTVGEMSSTTVEHGLRYTQPARHELDMVFQFHHLKVDYPDGEKWALADADFHQLKQILSMWQVKLHEGGGWNALFWCNHDQPRIVSRFGDEGRYRKESAKMLATTLHMMQGTPYIYQGEELGMTNPNFARIDDYRDVESLNAYGALRDGGMSEKDTLTVIQQRSRDNARTPMQWDASPAAGFTTGVPWIPVAPNYREINAEEALEDHDSPFYHYQQLIRLRKKYDIITYGDYRLLLPDDPHIFAYVRTYLDEALLVVSNFYEQPATFVLPDELLGIPAFARAVGVDGVGCEDSGTVGGGTNSESDGMPGDVARRANGSRVLIANYPNSVGDFRKIALRPYESIVYYLS